MTGAAPAPRSTNVLPDAEPTVVVAAYPAMPVAARSDARSNSRFLTETLERTHLDGLEIPWGSAEHVPDERRLLATLARSGEHSLTLITAMMEARGRGSRGRAGSDPGLASLDDSARRRALDLVYSAKVGVETLADRAGRRVIASIVVHSAPAADMSRLALHGSAFARSLEEIASWDWCDAELQVEHCDSVAGVSPRKGFLPLETEVEAVLSVHGASPVGIVVNWGRSALETHETTAGIEHALEAERSGALRGLGVSGISGQPTVAGGAWTDQHLPARLPLAVVAGFGASLLGRDELDDFVAAPATIPSVTVKVAAPEGPDPLSIVVETSEALVAAVARRRSRLRLATPHRS